MLSPELYKLKIQLEAGVNMEINEEELLVELQNLDSIEGHLQESLSLSGKVCPTCGRGL